MKAKFIGTSIVICIVLGIALLVVFHDINNKNIDWIRDLNYSENQIHNMSIGFFDHCPYVQIKINNNEIKIGFDTGYGTGIMLTTAVKGKVNYKEIGKEIAYNSDGTYRGDGSSILLDNINVFGEDYSDVKASLTDWRMYGSIKSNGTIGLKYFQGKVVTLDYKNKKIAVSDKSIDYNSLPKDKYIILPLIKPSANELNDLLFFEGEVNGKESTIYLDTGSSRSFINLEDNNNAADAEVKLGDKKYKFNKLKSGEIKFTEKFQYPLRLAINSDILNSNHFVVTIDKIQNKLIIHQL